VRPARGMVLAAGLLAASPALAAKKPLSAADRIDVNRAAVTELMRLPGLGVKRAQAIVAYRAKQPFRSPDDLLAVKGIGPSWVARVRANLTFAAAPPATAPASAAGAQAAAAPKK